MLKTYYDKADLLAAGEGILDGFDGFRLPAPPLLMMDRIDLISAEDGKYNKGLVVAQFDVNPAEWFFACHFLGDPVMPGTLGLEAMWQVASFFLAWSGGKGASRTLGAKNVKFTGQVTDKVKTVEYRVDIKEVDVAGSGRCVVDGRLYADGKEIYEAEDITVMTLA